MIAWETWGYGVSVCSLRTRNNEATASIHPTESFEGSWMDPAQPSPVCWSVHCILFAYTVQSSSVWYFHQGISCSCWAATAEVSQFMQSYHLVWVIKEVLAFLQYWSYYDSYIETEVPEQGRDSCTDAFISYCICFHTWAENINLSDSVASCISYIGNLYRWKCSQNCMRMHIWFLLAYIYKLGAYKENRQHKLLWKLPACCSHNEKISWCMLTSLQYSI
jgi:hypothetical protein